MGDIRFRGPYDRLQRATDRARVLAAMEDDEVIQALAHASRERDPLVANVLATEAMNRMRRSRIISNHLADAALVVDQQMVIMFVNPAFLALLGGDPDEYVGRRFDEALRVESMAGDPIAGAPACPVRQTIETGGPHELAVRIGLRSGTLVPVQLVARPVATEGIVEGAVTSLRDLRTELEASRRAHEAAERLQSLFDNNPLGVFTLDETGRVASVNPAGERMLRTPRNEIEGHHFGRFLDPVQVETAVERFAAVLEGATRVDEYRLRRSDGTYLHARVTGIPIWMDGAIVGMHGLAEDVTRAHDQLRHLDEVRRLSEALHDADSLGAAADAAVREGQRATGAAIVLLALRSAPDDSLWFARSSPPEAASSFPSDVRTPAHDATVEGRTIHVVGRAAVTTAYPELAATPLAKDTQSVLALPLSRAGRTMGAILFLFTTRHAISPEEDAVLTALSYQTAQTVGRIRARDALFEGHERHRRILQTCLDAVITTDTDGRIREWNPAAESMFGHRASEAIGARLVDLIIPPSLRATTGVALARDLAAGEGPMLGERIYVPAVHADGTEFPIEMAIAALPGQPRTFAAFARDMSDRRASADRARRLSDLVETASDAILSIDPDGRIVEWNHACERLFGWTRGEIAGSSIQRLIPAGRRAEERIPVRHDVRCARLHKDGHLLRVDLSTYPLTDAAGRPSGAGAVYRDAGHRIASEERDRNARRELERIVRDRTHHLEEVNADLQTFAAMASHDLRAPLRRVEALVADLLMELEDGRPDEVRDIAERIQLENRRAQRLVGDLLAFAAAGRAALSPTEVDVTHLAEDVAAEVDREEPGGTVTWTIEEGMHVHADAGLLRIALRNVMGNARKYAAAGRGARVRLSARKDAGATTIIVADDGPGFPEVEAARLFEPFTRLGTAGGVEGTGLGLATVDRILKRHGGHASAHSSPGHGAEFLLSFPDPPQGPPPASTT